MNTDTAGDMSFDLAFRATSTGGLSAGVSSVEIHCEGTILVLIRGEHDEFVQHIKSAWLDPYSSSRVIGGPFGSNIGVLS